jgi:hypothetical protein
VCGELMYGQNCATLLFSKNIVSFFFFIIVVEVDNREAYGGIFSYFLMSMVGYL